MPSAGVLDRTTSQPAAPAAAGPVALRIEAGRATLPPDSELAHGTVLALDQTLGEPVEVYAGERLVARGEVVLREEHFFVRVTEVIRDHPAS